MQIICITQKALSGRAIAANPEKLKFMGDPGIAELAEDFFLAMNRAEIYRFDLMANGANNVVMVGAVKRGDFVANSVIPERREIAGRQHSCLDEFRKTAINRHEIDSSRAGRRFLDGFTKLFRRKRAAETNRGFQKGFALPGDLEPFFFQELKPEQIHFLWLIAMIVISALHRPIT